MDLLTAFDGAVHCRIDLGKHTCGLLLACQSHLLHFSCLSLNTSRIAAAFFCNLLHSLHSLSKKQRILLYLLYGSRYLFHSSGKPCQILCRVRRTFIYLFHACGNTCLCLLHPSASVLECFDNFLHLGNQIIDRHGKSADFIP